MTETVSDNKRIAKNTMMLYVRMLLSIGVSLYTSRVVLQTLGVEDYGIYNVVGGVVAMFGFLNASMSGATSRFLTFEMGRGDFTKLRDTFSSALIVHIGIAIVVFVVAETVGLWFMANKLVIPQERMFAAHVVYQLSILSMMVGVTQVPYNASIIAHEKMDVYAYVELLNVFLKLGIVYLLLVGHFDKLILYSFLVLAVSFVVAMTYRIYCLRKFEECHFRYVWRRDILKPMLSFSTWDLFGNMSVIFNYQGYGMAMNMFYGVAINTAYGISNTVQGVLKGFSMNVITAFKPQIIKQYAKNNIEGMLSLVYSATKLSLTLYLIMAMPLLKEANAVLTLWLGSSPQYADYFLRIILCSCFFNLANIVLNIPIHATGRVKHLTFCTGFFYFISPFVFYVIMYLGFSIEKAFILIIATYFLTLSTTLLCVKRLISSFSIKGMIMKCYVPLFPVIAVLLFIFSLIEFENLLCSILTYSILSLVVLCVFYVFYGLPKGQRHKLMLKIIRMIYKNK